MKKILSYLSKFTLQDILEIEKQDRQFKAIEELYKNLQQKDFFFDLIITNSTVGYLLSSSGEEYWEEFSKHFQNKIFLTRQDIIKELIHFLPLSKGNKRLQNHKTKRLEKLRTFMDIFPELVKEGEMNFREIQKQLSQHMKQKIEAKTITYTVKMLSYGVRIKNGNNIVLPFEIPIPIDSRLIKIYEVFNNDKGLNIKEFYKQVSEKTQIPPIHLDGILWTNYKEILTI